MATPAISALTLALSVAIAFVAGIVRGITGFGGAMVMSPPLALLLGPHVTVPAVLLLESIIAAPMLWQTRKRITWRMMGAILAAACAFVCGSPLRTTRDSSPAFGCSHASTSSASAASRLRC